MRFPDFFLNRPNKILIRRILGKETKSSNILIITSFEFVWIRHLVNSIERSCVSLIGFIDHVIFWSGADVI